MSVLWRLQPAMMQVLPIANIAVMSLCILVSSHVYEVTREKTERRLLQMAQPDPLTGLANRARLSDIFEREKQRARRHNSPVTMFVLDLDHFKAVNDEHGHEIGDRALQHVTQIFRDCLRGTDLATRLGGEEFGTLLTNTNSHQGLDVAEKSARLYHRPTGCQRHRDLYDPQRVGGDGDSLRKLLRKADERLYGAKDSGHNQIIPVPTLTPLPDSV